MDLLHSGPLDPLHVSAVAFHELFQPRIRRYRDIGRGIEVAYLHRPLRLLQDGAVLECYTRSDLASLLQDERIALPELADDTCHIGTGHGLALEVPGHPCERHHPLGRDGSEHVRSGLPEIDDHAPPSQIVAEYGYHSAAGHDLVGTVLPRDLVEEQRLAAERSIGTEELAEQGEHHIDAVAHARTDVPRAVDPELPPLGSAYGARIAQKEHAAGIAPSETLLPVSSVGHSSLPVGARISNLYKR